MTGWEILDGNPAPGDLAAVRAFADHLQDFGGRMELYRGHLRALSRNLVDGWRDSADATAYAARLAAPVPMFDALGSHLESARLATVMYAAQLAEQQELARLALQQALVNPQSARARATADQIRDEVLGAASAFASKLEAAMPSVIAWQARYYGGAPLPPVRDLSDSTAHDVYEATLRRLADTTPLAFPGDPAEVPGYWESLDVDLRDLYIRKYPGVVGNTDGVPAADRDRANRLNLPRLQDELKSRIDALSAKEPTQLERLGPTVGDIVTPEWTEWNRKLNALRKKLAGIEAVAQTLNGQQDPPLLLLGLQNTGNGRAIISSGNPDTAANVATYVPGVGTNLTGIGGGVNRSNKMYATAQKMAGAPLAVVTWFGCDEPPDLVHGATEADAKHAAPLLDAFQAGLRATHQGQPSHNTVIGHSYGTTVVGESAAHGRSLDANDIVFLASPGVTVTDVSQLHLVGVGSSQNSHHVYASTAQGDPINLAAGINGPSPTDLGFDATGFSSAPDEGSWYSFDWNLAAHSSYWEARNPSLRNIGLIIAGRRSEVG